MQKNNAVIDRLSIDAPRSATAADTPSLVQREGRNFCLLELLGARESGNSRPDDDDFSVQDFPSLAI